MRPTILGTILLTSAGALLLAQSGDAPAKFEFADIHPSPKLSARFLFMQTGPVRNGRLEFKTATLVDLIQKAYDTVSDKIVGGPNWLEMDRFDVVAKVPPGTTPDSEKEMLQSLLADRFKLVVHKETRPLPNYVLTAGKKPQLKPAAGTEETGCKVQQSSGAGPAPEGGMRMQVNMEMNGTPMRLVLGPDMTIQFNCRNITMAKFAEGLNRMFGSGLGPTAVLNQTGLEGSWNFDVRWSMMMFGPMANNGERISVSDAIEKQLGLKLEEKPMPTEVLVVDSAAKPGPNPPGTAEALPVNAIPKEFEVASVKPADPGGRGGRFQVQPGGRVTMQGMPLHFLLNRAFNVDSNDQLTGVPAFADSERFDIDARAPGINSSSPEDSAAMAPMLRALLAERFKMTWHSEEQQLSAYSLVAAKPKMKRADPASRTYCKMARPQPGAPQTTRTLNCQNVTMEEFAEQLQFQTPELTSPVLDATELAGRWDFSLTWSMNFRVMFASGGGRGAMEGDPGAGPSASDPTGGISLLEAVEKQLGLKLEKQKRSMPVIVIDHLEPKPTEN